MPRYFLDVQDGDTLAEDPEGEEFIDLAAAREGAIATAVELASASLRSGEGLKLHRAILIKSANRMLLEVVPFGIAIQRGWRFDPNRNGPDEG